MRAFNLRLDRSRAARSLVLLFVVTATVFSVLPLLRYLRGHTIFDYELWYATGRHVLAGDEIYFFRAGKYDFMYPPPCALFLAGASLLGQGGLILLLVMINSAAWFCSAKLSAILTIGNRSTNKVLAISRSKCAGDRLCLVQLSPRPAQPCFARADAVRFCFVARKTRGCGRRIHRSCRRDQSVSGTCDRLSGLPTLLDSSRQPDPNTCISASDFACDYSEDLNGRGTTSRSGALEC